MSVEERLGEECKRIGLNQTESGHYEAGKGSLNADYCEAIASAGADVHYILTGQTQHDQLLAALKAFMEKMPGLALSCQCKAEMAQLLTALYSANSEQIKEALDSIPENKKHDEAKLTTAEKNLIDAYRKASGQDKSLMDRLAQLTEKAIENDSGIAEDVFDGE